MKRKKKSKFGIALLVVFLYLLAVGTVTFLIDGRHVKFVLFGDQTINVDMGGSFTDPGLYAVTTGSLFGDLLELDVRTTGVVDTNIPGTYEINYHAAFLGREYSTSRTVIVADRIAPVIELAHSEGYSPNWFTGYEEEGYTAFDNCDGDITERVIRVAAPGLVTYTVTDLAGNSTTVERVIPEAGAPEIILNGEAEMTVSASLDFSDPGFTAVDGAGNDLAGYVRVEGAVASYTPGSYELTYTIENGLGESVQAVRRVTVTSLRCPDTVDPDGKTIYLTFDDGPGAYTDQLLDILAKYNAKATFFVTADSTKYASCIGRAAAEGHTVGVHTYSHNYNTIYSSEEAYFEDFFKMEEIIKEQTGAYTSIFRFPGGSSNTVSKFNPGIMSRLAAAMTDLGYKYFDWNVTSGDAGETTKTEEIVQNVIDGCSQRKVSIVLQHDIKDYSVNAVEEILVWGISNGYNFRALDISSPDAHHGISN